MNVIGMKQRPRPTELRFCAYNPFLRRKIRVSLDGKVHYDQKFISRKKYNLWRIKKGTINYYEQFDKLSDGYLNFAVWFEKSEL
jgi:hypothetical protein